MSRRKALGALLFGSAAAAATAVGASPATADPPRGGKRRIPNVEVVDQDGRSYRFYDDLVRDRVFLVNFMYADCQGICPTQTANLKRVYALLGDRVGRDIQMYSITLRPAVDTPQHLKHYTEMHGIGPAWRFLTGAASDIEHLRRALGFYTSDAAEDGFAESHIGMVRYGSEALDRWGGAPAASRPEILVNNVLTMIGPAHSLVPDVA